MLKITVLLCLLIQLITLINGEPHFQQPFGNYPDIHKNLRYRHNKNLASGSIMAGILGIIRSKRDVIEEESIHDMSKRSMDAFLRTNPNLNKKMALGVIAAIGSGHSEKFLGYRKKRSVDEESIHDISKRGLGPFERLVSKNFNRKMTRGSIAALFATPYLLGYDEELMRKKRSVEGVSGFYKPSLRGVFELSPDAYSFGDKTKKLSYQQNPQSEPTPTTYQSYQPKQMPSQAPPMPPQEQPTQAYQSYQPKQMPSQAPPMPPQEQPAQAYQSNQPQQMTPQAPPMQPQEQPTQAYQLYQPQQMTLQAPPMPPQEQPTQAYQSTSMQAPQEPPVQMQPQAEQVSSYQTYQSQDSYGYSGNQAQSEGLVNTCAIGTVEAIHEGSEITETYCRCPTGSYGIDCTENFENPCYIGSGQYHSADQSFGSKYFIECSWNMPYLFKCPASLIWNQELLTCDWAYGDSYGSHGSYGSTVEQGSGESYLGY